MAKDYLDTFKDGIGLVGKFAAQGVSKMAQQIKGEPKEEKQSERTGLYYQRYSKAFYGEMIPVICFHESVFSSRLTGGFLKKIKRSQADKYFINACQALLFGDLDLAILKLKEVLAIEPQYTDSYFFLGALNLIKKEFVKSEEYFSKCRLLPMGLGDKINKYFPSLRLSIPLSDNLSFTFYPDSIGLNLLLAISQRNSEKLSLASQTLEQILSVMPDSLEMYLFLGAFYYEAGWDDKIIDCFKEIVPETDIQLIIIQFVVNAWINKGNYSLAEGILQKAMEAEGIEPYIKSDIRMLLSRVSKLSGRNAESKAYFTKVKKQYPNYLEIEERLGLKRKTLDIETKEDIEENDFFESIKEEVSKEEEKIFTKKIKPVGEIIENKDTRLIRLKSKDEKVDIVLPENLVIGRELGDLVLSWDSSASRKHACIYREKGQIIVEDLDSTNGTWINRHRIKYNRVLNMGDILLIGNTELYLEQE